MIVIEDRLRDLFNLIPDIQVNTNNLVKPKFGWGDKLELNRYLELYDSSSYPLIWLLPDEDKHNYRTEFVERDLTLILATLETRKDLLNPQRYQGSYKYVLNPLTSYVTQSLLNSSIINRVLSDEISVFKHPNYTDKEENGTIDKWDAVKIKCRVEFNNYCLKPIKWLNQ